MSGEARHLANYFPAIRNRREAFVANTLAEIHRLLEMGALDPDEARPLLAGLDTISPSASANDDDEPAEPF